MRTATAEPPCSRSLAQADPLEARTTSSYDATGRPMATVVTYSQRGRDMGIASGVAGYPERHQPGADTAALAWLLGDGVS
jgi:hypothetical protein